MTFILKKEITKVFTVIIPTLEWKNDGLYSRQSRPKPGGGFEKFNLKVEQTFGLDMWQMQAGYFWWDDGKRFTFLASVDQPEAEKPHDAAVDCYSVPVYSPELNGRADLIIDNAGGFLGFHALIEEINACPETKQGMVPVIKHVETLDSPDGAVPLLHIEGWTPRPDRWGERLIAIPK